MAMRIETDLWMDYELGDDAATSEFDRLVEGGVELPFPAALDDQEVSAKLWEVIGRLAGMGLFLVNTDHLSDRELYERLWTDVLREEARDDKTCSSMEGCGIIDLVGSGSEEEILEWLTYYADDKARYDFIGVLGGTPMPDREDTSYDRDRCLPAPLFCRGEG